MELTERQQTILKKVVEEYILTAAPVPSERLAGQPGLRVSSATVRNELVELEEMGLLAHPHTSSGRVPSDVGYRYYIDHLMSETWLSPTEQQTIWHQFHQVEAEVDEWGPLAAAVTAHSARSAALVTRPQARRERVKRVEPVFIQEDVVLLVLIMRSGGVQQRTLRMDQPVEREQLIRAGNRLSELLEGTSAAEVSRTALQLQGLDQALAQAIARLMEQTERSWGDALYYEGINFVSGEPEFGRADRIMQLLDALQRGAVLSPLLQDTLESDRLKVVIGSENELLQMQGCSLILKRYGPSDDAEGVVGVVGPTRMRYWRAAALVRFMADLLDRLAEESLRERR